jgi:lipopolysaccharide biosynthesis glycosyltransferase
MGSFPSSLQLVTAADEAFAMPMAVTLFSVLSNLPPQTEIWIRALDAGVTAESKRRIRRVVCRTSPTVHLGWTCPDTSDLEPVELDLDARFSSAIYYRLLIPEVLPDACSRALYLDSDLVAERSILPLWRRSFGDNAALAVPERTVSCPKNGVAEWRRLGLDADAPYFNSGVMLMNLEAWREQNLHGKTIEYLLDPENDFCYPGDQEALNAVLAGQWEPLDNRWNAFSFLYKPEPRAESEEMLGIDLTSARDEPYILHYTSDEKPWQWSCGHPKRDRFYHYLWHSGWFSMPEYVKWRALLSFRKVKDVTRPYRHRIGLRR